VGIRRDLILRIKSFGIELEIMEAHTYWGSEEDTGRIGRNLLKYLARNPSCWNEIKRATGYSNREVADGMAFVKNNYGRIITYRDSEDPFYQNAPPEIRDIYQIDGKGTDILEKKLNELKNEIESLGEVLVLMTVKN